MQRALSTRKQEAHMRSRLSRFAHYLSLRNWRKKRFAPLYRQVTPSACRDLSGARCEATSPDSHRPAPLRH